MSESRHGTALGPWRRRTPRAYVTLVAAVVWVGACSPGSEPTPPPAVEEPAPTPTVEPPQEDLASVKWEPKFEADYNTMKAQPWVEPVTKAEQDEVVVKPDGLEFSAATSPEVRDWAPGRVVVSAPGEGDGKNPFGFARRVVSVAEKDGKITVVTETVGLEDIVEGDFQAQYDPATAKEVDMSKVDLEWAAANLYQNNETVFMPGEPLIDDEPLPGEDTEVPASGPFFKKLAKAVGGAAKAVASAAGSAVKTVVSAVLPSSFEGAAKLSPKIEGKAAFPVFKDMNYKKAINSKGKLPMELYIKGSADISASVLLNPAFQVGARIPTPGHKDAPPLKAWINVDARAESKIAFNVSLEAGIASAGGDAGSKLEERLSKNADFAQDILSKTREALTGDADMKPAGGWKKTLFVSRPATQVIMAGVVPVVLVETIQVDLECGFEAKASLTGKVELSQSASFKFSASYEKGGQPKIVGPTFTKANQRVVEFLGGGSLAVTCGLIPRVNVLLYDTLGLNVGVRGSLVGRATYESKCAETTTTPKGNLKLGLYANVGIQVGGRIQAPGSSYAGKSGTSLGFDIGPIEPWNNEWPIVEKEWDFAKGLGYCTPTCKNGALDDKEPYSETDADCGGGACPGCSAAKKCKKNSDCKLPGTCNGGFCRVDSCADGVQSGDETAVDCGGKKCATRCAVGKTCAAATDCASGFCSKRASTAAGVCVADHCSDGIVNGDETGVDCGGKKCAKCKTGALCAVASDCASGFSDFSYCVATSCQDRKVSATETGVDCGGASSCARCAVGLACGKASDCVSGLACLAGKCAKVPAPTCTDALKNGAETDVDCGGTCSTKCADTKACVTSADCTSAFCKGSICTAPTCTDAVKNGAETDVDCGGTCSSKCTDAKTCLVGADCTSTICTAGKCAASSCSDLVKNGSESDVDCGGSCSTKCADTKSCSVAADCTSGSCSGGKCAASSCSDLVKNGSETDVDCGGSCATKCADTKSCSIAADCTSGSCSGGKCAAPVCTDLVKNGSETDVDCGGICSAKCGDGKGCGSAADCTSGSCTAGTCAGASCTDSIKNGSETDVDCGGSCSIKCADTKGCSLAADCTSKVCVGGNCAAPTCTDAVKNATETDVDCGGSCSTKCADGKVCVGASDCSSGVCTAGACSASLDKLVFVTSTAHQGNFGGLAGADAICQGLATEALLPGTYKAFLSDSTSSASARLSRGSGAYKLVTGTVVATSATQFFSSSHAAPLDRNEKGVHVPSAEIWTGTNGSGTGTGGCGNWTSTSGTAACGLSSSSTSTWASVYSQFCDRAIGLYCVQQ